MSLSDKAGEHCERLEQFYIAPESKIEAVLSSKYRG
jgi:hypothetical protein